MSFGLDEQRLVVISGKANVEVDLKLSTRCNEVFAHEVRCPITYTPVYEKSEEEAHRKSTIW